MRKRIPNVDALIAFESVSRHQNFVGAANEISLTQSAICRQVCRLEEFLGQPLFNRIKRRLVLTDVGATYARQVREVLEKLETDALNVMTLKETAGNLTLAVTPTFAIRWLIPRLPLFVKHEPDVIVNLDARAGPFGFSSSIFDAAIYFGSSPWTGAVKEPLFQEELIPVCAPTLLGGTRQLHPLAFAGHPLLHQSSRHSSWTHWFAHVGVVGINSMRGPRYEMLDMLIKAAVAGMGIALVPRLFVQDELVSGRLIVPWDAGLKSNDTYHLVYPEDKRPTPALQSFKTWLLETLSREGLAQR